MIKTNMTPIHLRSIPLTSGEKKAPQAGRSFIVFCLPPFRHYSGF